MKKRVVADKEKKGRKRATLLDPPVDIDPIDKRVPEERAPLTKFLNQEGTELF